MTKSTTERYLASKTPAERKKFDEGYKNFALSEMVFAALQHDKASAEKLASIAGVSPSIALTLCSPERDNITLRKKFRTLEELGFKILLEREGETTPLTFR